LDRPRRLATALIPAVLIAVVVASFLGTGGTTTAAPAKAPCNGEMELCERPLDRVALRATHKSMSVPLPGWYSSKQERPIGDQLDDGIRGLLIDTHYADHSFCELGAARLESGLDDIHTFLVANPGAVLVVINQDYVTPEDFVGAVKDADLEQFAYRGPVCGNWPTMREMVDSGERVVFLAENHAGGAPWYHLAYDSITEETPYAFTKVPQLTSPGKLDASCEPNRGPEGRRCSS